MTAAVQPETSIPVAAASSPAADADVLCPLCDYNLRGLVEPKCPECGYRFTWPEVLDPKLRRHEYLFEHHPRHNLWSFWRTARGGLRPRRFWSSLHPSQPSNGRRLVHYWLLASSMTVLAVVTPLAVSAAGFINQQHRMRAQAVALMTSPTWNNVPQNVQAKQAILTTYGTLQAYATAMYPADWRIALRRQIQESGPIVVALAVLAAWPWVTLAALMVFRISMRRARIRTVHVLRCVLYSFDGRFWLGLLSLALGPVAVGLMMLPAPGLDELVPVAVALVYFAVFVFMLYRLVLAYRLYLRFDHPAATVLASQLIAALFVLVVLAKVAEL
jgi:hypothetical protein